MTDPRDRMKEIAEKRDQIRRDREALAAGCDPETCCDTTGECVEFKPGQVIEVDGNDLPMIRQFDTGATRNVDNDNLDFEGFLSPLALQRFAEYMHSHRTQADGTLRASDNWQKGIPFDSYMKSGFRHFMDWWMNHRGLEARDDVETALCALLFNVQGYLHEYLKEKS